eukprot:647260-Prymnesium_polylepis.1
MIFCVPSCNSSSGLARPRACRRCAPSRRRTAGSPPLGGKCLPRNVQRVARASAVAAGGGVSEAPKGDAGERVSRAPRPC